jgi:NADH:ubiquinone oxidoreductase subunit F (NADH-binding)
MLQLRHDSPAVLPCVCCRWVSRLLTSIMERLKRAERSMQNITHLNNHVVRKNCFRSLRRHQPQMRVCPLQSLSRKGVQA